MTQHNQTTRLNDEQTGRGKIQENIFRLKQSDLAIERFLYWLNHPERDFKHQVNRMAGIWGTVLNEEEYFNIPTIDYRVFDGMLSLADKHAMTKFDI